MLSLSQLTPVAYLADGEILCIKCGDKAGLPISAQIIEYSLDSDFAEDGCWCGECGKELVEPYVEDEPEEYAGNPTILDSVEQSQALVDAQQGEPLLQGVCKDCGNGTLNNELNPAFTFGDDDRPFCSKCGSTHLDLL